MNNEFVFVLLKNLVEKTVEQYGCIDCLINNAGWRKLIKTVTLLLNGDKSSRQKTWVSSVLGFYCRVK